MDLWFRATLRSTLERHDHDNKKAATEAYETVASRYDRHHVARAAESGSPPADGSAESTTATEAQA